MSGMFKQEELRMQRSKIRILFQTLFVIGTALLLSLCFSGCHGSPAGDRLRVDKLDGGDFYRTAPMIRPRYEHQSMSLDDGTVLVVSGTDERGFTAIDECELFDQQIMVEPEPPSKTGGWIDTDFEGENLRLEAGGRIYHQLVRADNGNVMVHLGVRDGLLGDILQHPEIYDRTTRKFTEISGTMVEPRFHASILSVSEGEFVFFGGQIHMDVTIVNPDYPPNDPRFIQEIDSYPSIPSVEKFESSIDSEDGYGNFQLLADNSGREVLMVSSLQGRALHTSVRLAGFDKVLGNGGDVLLHAGGIKTLSPLFAPNSKLRRMTGQELIKDIEVYDGFTMSSFLLSSVALRMGRAHGVEGDNLGWDNDFTFDGMRGLSNLCLIYSGSDDTLPTTGVFECEGFYASFSGFGPGSGIELMRTEFPEGETILSVLQDTLDININPGPVADLYGTMGAVYSVDPNTGLPNLEAMRYEPGSPSPLRLGKFFGVEAAFTIMWDPQELFNVDQDGDGDIIEEENDGYLWYNQDLYYGQWFNRVHTDSVHVIRNVFTDHGARDLGNLFVGAGGMMLNIAGAQYQEYDIPPINSGEYYDPYYNIINAFAFPQHNPYNLNNVRTFFSIQENVPFPQNDTDNQDHPNPVGCLGAWLVTDGFVPYDGFEGYQWLHPFPADAESLVVRALEKGRAWHTVALVPGEDGELGTIDDRVAFIGGGDDVLLWGGSPVVPSTEIYVPITNLE